jgi:CheY-like chemotaxis protein
MGGDINVTSEYGKGSTFTINIPQKIRVNKVLAYVDNPHDKSVLVYERREVYINSIVYAIDNLGIQYAHVTSDTELQDKMAERTYAFMFISFGLFTKNREIIRQLGPATRVVVLTEFGEIIPDKSLNILAMPVYCIPIAHVLNDESGTFSYNENNDLIAGFTAPEANVLVVDDIITNLNVAKGLLMPYRMQVDMCKSGIMAIEAVKTNRYDLVFMDHLMPEIDGMETTKRIRALGEEDPYYSNVPIVALTANAVSGTREMFLGNGFNDFLSKPIDTIKLNSILEKWIPREKKTTSL